MDKFDFDSVLLPLNFPSWIKGKFGPSVYERAQKAGMGILRPEGDGTSELARGNS